MLHSTQSLEREAHAAPFIVAAHRVLVGWNKILQKKKDAKKRTQKIHVVIGTAMCAVKMERHEKFMFHFNKFITLHAIAQVMGSGDTWVLPAQDLAT